MENFQADNLPLDESLFQKAMTVEIYDPVSNSMAMEPWSFSAQMIRIMERQFPLIKKIYLLMGGKPASAARLKIHINYGWVEQ